MLKLFLVGVFFQITIECLTQPSIQSTIPGYSWHPPSEDPVRWQRLNLMQSATYFRVVKEAELDFDSCLVYASRSLGLSRIPVLAEGIDSDELPRESQWMDERKPHQAIQRLSKTTGKKHLELLISLGAYYAFEPRSNYRTDSVEYFLFKAIDESDGLKEGRLRRQALCLLGKMYIQTNELKKADSIFNLVIHECDAAEDKATKARAFEYRARYPEFNPATIQSRIADLLQSAALYNQLKNVEGEINTLTDAGYLLVVTYQQPKAREHIFRALHLAEEIGYPYLHYMTDILALALIMEGKFGEPLKYTLQTIKTAEATRDSIGWGYFYNRLGGLYDMVGKQDEGVKWISKGLDRLIMANDDGLYLLLFNVVSNKQELHQNQEALDLALRVTKKIPARHPKDKIFYMLSLAYGYLGTKQYDRAERYAKEAEQILNQSVTLRSALHRSMINIFYGNYYFRKHEYSKSKKFWDEFLKNPYQYHGGRSKRLAYLNLAKIDSVLGNHAAAVGHYKLYVKAIDSVYRVSKIRQAEEFQVIYQTQEKENQITSLREQAKLEEENAKQASLVRDLTIIITIALLGIAGLLFRQNRLRKKNNAVITKKNEQLQHFLNEKEWLLKEIHHRVKNNLQIVMSLLNSQSAYIDNAPALTAIHNSQHRVHAISLIHQKLYNTENVSSIDISFYIRELVSYLSDCFNTGQRIRFELTIERLEMDVSQAVPLGLILNEAITNAIKYAFPDERDGVIHISLAPTKISRHFMLTISDNGIGMPPNFDTKKPGSLGMSLIAGLSEDLEGSFSIECVNGTTLKISFVHELGIKRTAKADEPVASAI